MQRTGEKLEHHRGTRRNASTALRDRATGTPLKTLEAKFHRRFADQHRSADLKHEHQVRTNTGVTGYISRRRS
jgi:hypothetical protein